MDARHTPGPWRIGYGGSAADDYAVITSPHADYPICNLDPRGYTQTNARLIAIAPAMFDLLTESQERMSNGWIARRDALLAGLGVSPDNAKPE